MSKGTLKSVHKMHEENPAFVIVATGSHLIIHFGVY